MCDYQVDRIFSEKLSGANADRPQLKAMLDYVREGDTLYVESIAVLLENQIIMWYNRSMVRAAKTAKNCFPLTARAVFVS